MCTFSMMYFPDMSELPGIALVWMMLSPWMSILTKPPFELKDTWDTKVKLYIHTYIYFYLLYMIYIYICLIQFQKEASFVQQARGSCWIGMCWFSCARLFGIEELCGKGIRQGCKPAGCCLRRVIVAGVPSRERSHIPFKSFLGKWYSSSIGGKWYHFQEGKTIPFQPH